ncbi:MAG: PAS domain S-box protein [Bacteroidetes bacterium]|nr:PAS domain S-box protein [Bacteroidota bacterium]
MKPITETGFLREVFNSIPNPIFALDKKRCCFLANQAFCDLVAMPVQEVTGLKIDRIFPQEVSGLFTGKPESANNTEVHIQRGNGTINPYLVSVLSAQFENQALAVVTLKDLTDYKRTQASLLESEALYRTVVNQLPNPILIHINGKVVFANDLILGITGLSKDEVIGKDVVSLLTDPADAKNTTVFRNLSGDAFIEEEEFEIRTENRKVVIKNFLLRNSKLKYQGQDAVMTILIDMTERKHLEKYVLGRVIETEEKDRKQFAADLHDDLGPILSSIKLHLGMLEHAKSPEKSAATLATCNQLLAETIAKMRIVANNLMPRLIENFGLEAAVNSFIGTMQHEGIFEISFISNLKGRRFQKQTELHFYRIICELINNTVKHAGATNAVVRLNYLRGLLKLDYTDNGKGYDISEINKNPGGMGLGNIIQRVKLLDAKIQFTQRKGKTAVTVERQSG